MCVLKERELALKYNKEHLDTLLEPMKDVLLAPALKYIKDWLDSQFDFVKRPDLIEVVAAVHKLDSQQICWSILSKVLLDSSITLQACMGMFFNDIGKYVSIPYRRGHVLNVYVEALLSTELINITRIGKYNYLKSNVIIGDLGQRRYGYTLPKTIKPIVKSNKDIAYEGMHVITGGKLKQHDNEVCLDHIQRLSSTAYKVEERILNMVQPVFKETPKYKERLGRYETEKEITDRRKEFDRFERELPERIKIMIDAGNKFYFGNRYDTRLRSYIKAYHFDYIGNKYIRALVQPVKGELATGVNDYL